MLLLCNSGLKRVYWKLARVAELHRSADGVVKVATIELLNGVKMQCLINHWYPLKAQNQN